MLWPNLRYLVYHLAGSICNGSVHDTVDGEGEGDSNGNGESDVEVYAEHTVLGNEMQKRSAPRSVVTMIVGHVRM